MDQTQPQDTPCPFASLLQEGEELRLLDHMGFAGYAVTSHGRVLSSHQKPACIIRPTVTWGGYLTVWLYCTRDGLKKRVGKRIHRLVCEAFYGPPPPEKPLCLHKNDDPQDNRVHMLRWGSHQDNADDRVRLGKTPTGSKHGKAKLDAQMVKTIRHAYFEEGQTQAKLAKAYGVHDSTISAVLKSKSWKTVDNPYLDKIKRKVAIKAKKKKGQP